MIRIPAPGILTLVVHYTIQRDVTTVSIGVLPLVPHHSVALHLMEGTNPLPTLLNISAVTAEDTVNFSHEDAPPAEPSHLGYPAGVLQVTHPLQHCVGTTYSALRVQEQ